MRKILFFFIFCFIFFCFCLIFFVLFILCLGFIVGILVFTKTDDPLELFLLLLLLSLANRLLLRGYFSVIEDFKVKSFLSYLALAAPPTTTLNNTPKLEIPSWSPRILGLMILPSIC